MNHLYGEAGIYKYLVVNMYPKKLASDCITFWGETEFPFYDSVNNLVSNMIYRGKMLYFTNAMLPDQPDTINWGFSAKNLEYCVENEKAMWTELIEKKYLFNTDRFTIDKFILEGPYTKDFGRESPARAAVWIGYKIVSAYMAKNSDITLPMLMAEKELYEDTKPEFIQSVSIIRPKVKLFKTSINPGMNKIWISIFLLSALTIQAQTPRFHLAG